MWSSECPLGAPPRGSLHFRNRISALPGRPRATLRTTHCRAYRRQQLEVLAFGADPYEPLEKAINVINKVLTVGSKKSAASNGNGNGGGSGRERWVQFGTVASSRLSLQDLTAKDAELDREATSRLLQEYLSLPVEEYSLLDPKWVVREQNDNDDNLNKKNNDSAKKSRSNSFRVSVPLKDMLGVDICPQVSIEARPDLLNGQVTLIGTRAVLGSPGLDDMFKLKLVAVMRCRSNDRHLPGRPVQRLKQWAAKRRGDGANKNLVTTTIDAGAVGARSSFSGAAVAEVVDIDVDQIHFSSEEEDEEDDVARYNGSESESGTENGTSLSAFRFSTDLSSDNLDSVSSSSSSLSSFEEARNNAVVTTLSSTTTTTTSVAAQAPLLDCRVQIDMAVKVPGALRVVPNGLLGYAGSVITKTVLNAVLPNFLQLLSADFKQWVAGSGQRRNCLESKNGGEEDGGDSEALGSLFTQLIGNTTSSSSESTDI